MCERGKRGIELPERLGTSESLRERGTSSSKLEVRERFAAKPPVSIKCHKFGQKWPKMGHFRSKLADFKLFWPKIGSFLMIFGNFFSGSEFSFPLHFDEIWWFSSIFKILFSGRFSFSIDFGFSKLIQNLWFHAGAGFWFSKMRCFWNQNTPKIGVILSSFSASKLRPKMVILTNFRNGRRHFWMKLDLKMRLNLISKCSHFQAQKLWFHDVAGFENLKMMCKIFSQHLWSHAGAGFGKFKNEVILGPKMLWNWC